MSTCACVAALPAAALPACGSRVLQRVRHKCPGCETHRLLRGLVNHIEDRLRAPARLHPGVPRTVLLTGHCSGPIPERFMWYRSLSVSLMVTPCRRRPWVGDGGDGSAAWSTPGWSQKCH